MVANEFAERACALLCPVAVALDNVPGTVCVANITMPVSVMTTVFPSLTSVLIRTQFPMSSERVHDSSKAAVATIPCVVRVP